LVAEVAAGSAADEAGLLPGDIIVRMAKRDIDGAQDFRNAEGRVAIGDELKIEYLRNGKTRKTRLEIQPVPALSGADLDYRLEGAQFTDLTERDKQHVLSGVLIDELDSRSRLARQGLEVGDIITGAYRQKVRDLDDFREVLKQKRNPLTLQVVRGDRAYVVRVD